MSRSASIISGMLIDIYRYNPVYFQNSGKTNVTSVILEIQKYISTNFREEITLDILSEKFFFSTFYISRKFKEITGYNIKNYIILNRMAIAKELLRLSNKSILEISVEVGYENVDQFTRIFKQYDGLSPSSYRALYRHIDHDNSLDPSDWNEEKLNHYRNAH
jgi:YesN/AraC family two-component response regulator